MIEIFRNFEITDTEENIKKALEEFTKFYKNKWKKVIPPKELDDKYVIFKYQKAHSLSLKIFLIKTENGMHIANIIPEEINSISVKEYNEAVMDFYVDFCRIIKQKQPVVTTNIFDPLQIMSEKALSKLKDFYYSANKSTGSSHPDDERRWFAFICQTIEDNKIINCEQEFLNFLQDKDYWGIDVFSEEIAFELLHEYNKITGCLQYYKKNCRG